MKTDKISITRNQQRIQKHTQIINEGNMYDLIQQVFQKVLQRLGTVHTRCKMIKKLNTNHSCYRLYISCTDNSRTKFGVRQCSYCCK